MGHSRALAFSLAAIACLALLFAEALAADAYPTRPIRMIAGFARGGGTDLTARPVAAKLSELLGQQVIADQLNAEATKVLNMPDAKAQ